MATPTQPLVTCPPSKVLCLQWVKEFWEALPAGISVTTDGTEDEHIHCLREAIHTETATLIDINTTNEEEEADCFADIEEGENENVDDCYMHRYSHNQTCTYM